MVWLPPSLETFPAPPPGRAELWTEGQEAGLGRPGFWGGIMKEVSEAALDTVGEENSLCASECAVPHFGSLPRILESHCLHWVFVG